MRSPSARSALMGSMVGLKAEVVELLLPNGLMKERGVTEEGSLGRFRLERILEVKGPLEFRLDPNSVVPRGEGSAINVEPLLTSDEFIAAASFLIELWILEGENRSSSSREFEGIGGT